MSCLKPCIKFLDYLVSHPYIQGFICCCTLNLYNFIRMSIALCALFNETMVTILSSKGRGFLYPTRLMTEVSLTIPHQILN